MARGTYNAYRIRLASAHLSPSNIHEYQAGDTNFYNTGAVVLGQAGGITTFVGGLATIGNSSNPSGATLAGTIATTNTRLDIGVAALGEATIINTGNNAAAILNVGAVTAAGFGLTLNSGSTSGATMSLTSMADTSGGLTIANAGGLATIGAVGSGSGLLTNT